MLMLSLCLLYGDWMSCFAECQQSLQIKLSMFLIYIVIMFYCINVREIRSGSKKMDNTETLTTLGTADAGGRQTKPHKKLKR